MVFMSLPKIKGKYHYEVDIDESYAEISCIDDWNAAYLCDGRQRGVTYNFCRDSERELSAFYKTDCENIDENTYIYYEIDFGMDNWKEKLIDAMINAYEEFWEDDND